MKKTLRLSLVIVAAALILAGASPATAAETPQRARLMEAVNKAKAATPQLSPAEAKKLIASQRNLFILDVREPEELKTGKIAKSVNIPRGFAEFRVVRQVTDLNQPILTYCQTGSRGALVAEALKKLGYTNVKNLAGGFREWDKEEKKAK